MTWADLSLGAPTPSMDALYKYVPLGRALSINYLLPIQCWGIEGVSGDLVKTALSFRGGFVLFDTFETGYFFSLR